LFSPQQNATTFGGAFRRRMNYIKYDGTTARPPKRPTEARPRTQDRIVNKRLLWNVFQYLLAAALLTYVIYKRWGPAGSEGRRYVWRPHVDEGQPVHGHSFLAGFAVSAAAVFLTLVRWYLLVRAQGLQVSLPEALRLGLIGCYYSAFLPGSV